MSEYNEAQNAAQTAADANKAAFQAATDASTKAAQSAFDTTKAAADASVQAGKTVAGAATDATVKSAKLAADYSADATEKLTAAANEFGPVLESASKKAQEIAESLAAHSKQAGLGWLDAYDQGFAAYLQLKKDLAGASHIDWVSELSESNTQALTALNEAYTKAVRDLLK